MAVLLPGSPTTRELSCSASNRNAEFRLPRPCLSSLAYFRSESCCHGSRAAVCLAPRLASLTSRNFLFDFPDDR